MNIKSILIILLCCWLPLQSSANLALGCDYINVSMQHAAEPPHHHCDHMTSAEHHALTPTKIFTDKKNHSSFECSVCKTHCSSVSVLLFINTDILQDISKQIFPPAVVQHADIVYLDLPQRPPQVRT